MAETNGERWEGVENFNLDGAGEWLFVPPGLAHLTGSWQDYLRENSIALWRYWWEHWWLWPCDCCCCCCDETRPAGGVGTTPAPKSNLTIDFHVVKLFTILVGGGGRLPWEIHLGWAISGASGQVSVTLEYGGSSRQYRMIGTFSGASMADYTVQPPGGGFIYGPQTVWFRLTASDPTGASASQELPVNLP